MTPEHSGETGILARLRPSMEGGYAKGCDYKGS
jgi:hypothetical protein